MPPEELNNVFLRMDAMGQVLQQELGHAAGT